MGPKNQKKMSADFPFFQYSFVAPFYPTGINIGTKRPQHVLKHAERQSETRRVQMFGAKSGAIASGPQPSSLKIDLKALILLFRTLYK